MKKNMETLLLNSENQEIIECYKNRNIQYSTDIGIDLYIAKDIEIEPQSKACIDFEIKCQLNDKDGNDLAYMLVPRSSIHKSYLFLCNGFGVIDPSYRGHICCYVFNYSSQKVNLSKEDRIVQLVSFSGRKMTLKLDQQITSDTDRGTCGFGSTGK